MNKAVRSLLLKTPKVYDFIRNIKNNYFLSFYLNKVHEPDFNAFKLICDDRPQLFLDIGANVGMSALSFFTLKPDAQVISFEPNPINYPYLDRLLNKFQDFQYIKSGLGDQAGVIDFYYPIYNGKEMTALGACDYQKAQSWLNKDTVYFFDASKLKIEKITIKINTLDSYELRPEFIKIDVEGFEYQVLLGGQQTIKQNRPVLLIEGVAKTDKVHNLLQEWDYDIYRFYHHKFYLNQFDCANNFFVPKEKTAIVQPYLASENEIMAIAA
jgi:FkbM family methyltransferase